MHNLEHASLSKVKNSVNVQLKNKKKKLKFILGEKRSLFQPRYLHINVID